jgi:hypothetical protein
MPSSAELVKSFHANLRRLLSLDALNFGCRPKIIVDKHLEHVVQALRANSAEANRGFPPRGPPGFHKSRMLIYPITRLRGGVMVLEDEHVVGLLFAFCAFWCMIYIVLQFAETQLGVVGWTDCTHFEPHGERVTTGEGLPLFSSLRR